ncbi:hypothetical protein BGZ76_008099 [Entomortierella beljakovae]|nr:hypothetical protein BGZ76_008099 [Entomortierella beljakovae]
MIVSSVGPLSDLSSGANSGALNNNSNGNTSASAGEAAHTLTSTSAAKPRKSPIESKAQKPSFLSLLFCCGANLNENDPPLIVTPVNRPTTVSIGKGSGKKSVAGHVPDEKNNIPVQPAVDVNSIGPDESTGDHSQSPEIELQGLLGPIAPEHIGKKCLVLDLDETLVHSSFKLIPQADYIVPVEIDNQSHNVYVIKRPGVDTFLQKMGEIYEVVIFTASLSKYADPVLDMLDIHRVIKHRLFRESCFNHKGNYVKDLSVIGRDLKNTIIIDNSPASYIFHQTNAVPISSWFNDPHDTELLDLIPFLADMTVVDDVNPILDTTNEEQS